MIDWPLLIHHFQKASIGVNRLATEAGVPGKHLTDIVTGSLLEPPFSTGMKILDLHHDYFPNLHHKLTEDFE
jgi:hypothetical protein